MTQKMLFIIYFQDDYCLVDKICLSTNVKTVIIIVYKIICCVCVYAHTVCMHTILRHTQLHTVIYHFVPC